jgi:hypothetical protein
MKGKQSDPPSNVVRLRKSSRPSPPSTSTILEGFELIKIFLTIGVGEDRKKVIELAKRLSTNSANKKGF